MKLTSPDTLKALMDQKNFSYERMARYAGCSKSFISHLTSGRKASCSPLLAENIAEALEVPLSILFVESPSAVRVQSVSETRRMSA
ncbi:helix-turn-helix domain-containing protein [Aeromicrobium sp. UC242_57]|uniref:helix-turn-helix domain-containing protein n=1 Tax=Aeromicrobium sp. UC242_57 TaxID=3374624 RepID=UPI00378C8E66